MKRNTIENTDKKQEKIKIDKKENKKLKSKDKIENIKNEAKDSQQKTSNKNEQKELLQKKDNKNETNEVSKKIPKEIRKRILKNISVAIIVVAYFLVLILAHQNMRLERLAGDIEIFAIAYLVSGLIVLEKAYKKDNGKWAITSIELLVLAFHTLSINHMINILKCDFNKYLLISSGVFSIYFILKAIVIYTKDRKEYLDSLSDISEIVNEDKPIIKEATKKSKKVDNKSKENVIDNVEKIETSKTDQKGITKNKKDAKDKPTTKKAETTKKTTAKTRKTKKEVSKND